jgi:DNA oxidative demethylase
MISNYELQKGLVYYPNYLLKYDINNIKKDIDDIITKAPLYNLYMPYSNKKLSVEMTNCGVYGWYCDKTQPYTYIKNHPKSNKKWPNIPKSILDIWFDITNIRQKPNCCLINIYNKDSKMGLHIDNDEKNFSYPVLSISLGATAKFNFEDINHKINKTNIKIKTKSIKLYNTDVLVLKDESRLIKHGISKIYSNEIFQNRVNLTLRKVD